MYCPETLSFRDSAPPRDCIPRFQYFAPVFRRTKYRSRQAYHLTNEFQGTVAARGTQKRIRGVHIIASNGRSIDRGVAIETIRRP